MQPEGPAAGMLAQHSGHCSDQHTELQALTDAVSAVSGAVYAAEPRASDRLITFFGAIDDDSKDPPAHQQESGIQDAQVTNNVRWVGA